MILVDKPSIVGPATITKPVCLGCLKLLESSSSSIVWCSTCNFPFCGEDCSNNRHQTDCKLLKGFCVDDILFDQANLVYAAIFVMRGLMLKTNDPEEYEKVIFLMSGDTSDIADSIGLKVFQMLAQNHCLSDVCKEDVLRIMGVKRTNANNMTNVLGKKGNILYPIYPLMNSHCYCNTFYSIDDNYAMELRAQRPILKGEEITTRYVSSFECQPKRQNKLWNNWKFLCQCKRCMDPTDLGTYFSAVKCKKCDTGYLGWISLDAHTNYQV